MGEQANSHLTTTLVVAGEMQWDVRENFRKSGEVLEQAAQRGGGITVPGGIHETFRYCTEEHGLLGKYW